MSRDCRHGRTWLVLSLVIFLVVGVDSGAQADSAPISAQPYLDVDSLRDFLTSQTVLEEHWETVDRVLDMMRTATNVWSDLVGTAVVNRFEGPVTQD